ncbi:hypothetical protein N008_01760 [Hymenobacter sp. APR13]|nr:hypothetical protein N008_01760 [Hymenobacter sp. APR13]
MRPAHLPYMPLAGPTGQPQMQADFCNLSPIR